MSMVSHAKHQAHLDTRPSIEPGQLDVEDKVSVGRVPLGRSELAALLRIAVLRVQLQDLALALRHLCVRYFLSQALLPRVWLSEICKPMTSASPGDTADIWGQGRP